MKTNDVQTVRLGFSFRPSLYYRLLRWLRILALVFIGAIGSARAYQAPYPTAASPVVVLNNGDSIVVKIGGAPTTTQPTYNMAFVDETETGKTAGSGIGSFNSGTEVTAVATPTAGKRLISSIIVCNPDTVSQNFTVSVANGANRYFLLNSYSLASNATVTFNAGGFVSATPLALPLDPTKGGTGFSSYTQGDMLYASSTTALSRLADVAAGSFLRSGGVGANPAYSTLVLPNAATTGDVMYGSSANTMSQLADVAAGRWLKSGGVATAPLYSTSTLAEASATNNRWLKTNGSNWSESTAQLAEAGTATTGKVLMTDGTNWAATWPMTYTTVATNQSPSSANAFTYYDCTSALTVTLPASGGGGVASSYALLIRNNSSGSITISPNAADGIDGGTVNNSLILAHQYEYVYLICTGNSGTGAWAVVSKNIGYARSSGDKTYNTTATLTDIPGLTWNVEAGKTYTFDVKLSVSYTAAQGFKVGTGGTATATSFRGSLTAIGTDGTVPAVGTTATFGAQVASSGGAGASTQSMIDLNGTIVVNAGGTFTIQGAQASSGGSNTTFQQFGCFGWFHETQ